MLGMHIYVISNGHGEDSIACALIKALKELSSEFSFTGIPLVGNGLSYAAEGIPILFDNPEFPSGGFIRTFKDLKNDIRMGLLSHSIKQRKAIKKALISAKLVICVGDIYCLWMGRYLPENTVFVPSAKSDTFMPHTLFERLLIKRFSSLVFPRDSVTEYALKSKGINAMFLGNPMMDDLVTSTRLEMDPSLPIIGILPGSRNEAYANLQLILPILNYVSLPFQACIAVAPSLDIATLQSITRNKIAVTTEFKALINQAHTMIGLSGTANEQAAYLGKKVLCFPGSGPQSTRKRFMEQRKLIGDSICFMPTQDPITLGNTLSLLMKKTTNILHEASQNASEKIAHAIVKQMIRL